MKRLDLSASSSRSPFLDYVLGQVRINTLLCSRQKHETGYTLQPRVIDDYNLIHVRRGRAAWVIGEQTVEMRPGDLVVVPPHVRHHAFSSTRRITIDSVHVKATLPDGQDVFEILRPPLFRHVDAGSRLDRYLAGFNSEWDRQDDAQTYRAMPAWGRLIALELLLVDAAKGQLSERPLDPIVAATLDEISHRVDQRITLTALAKWSGYSPQHLNRTFRRALGSTPLKYVAALRMERAALLISENKLTISRIASCVGIEDGYYFSRLFRQHFGSSPSKWRADAGSNSPSRRSTVPSPGKGPAR